MPVEISKLKLEDDALVKSLYQFLKEHKGYGYTRGELAKELSISKERVGDITTPLAYKIGINLKEHNGYLYYYHK